MMNDKKDVLFLGYVVAPESADVFTGVSVAGNKMQYNIITRLNKKANLTVITVHPMAPYPRDNVLFYKKGTEEIGDGIVTHNIGFLNLPLIKQFVQSHNCIKEAKKYIKYHPGAVVLTFNMFPQIGDAAVYLKKKYRSTVVSVLADPPIDDRNSRGIISGGIHSLYFGRARKNFKQADKVVTLNEFARNEYAPQADYIVVEGGINLSDLLDSSGDASNTDNDLTFTDGKRHLVYGGSLAEYSGIKELVLAMDEVKAEDIVLDIYGDGALRNWISEKKGNNVCFHGRVSNDQMLKILSEAWMLVNPRPVDTFMAKTTFPSKIFEYLLSGTPVLSTRLNGFTDDYTDKMYWIEKDNPTGIAEAINRVSNLPQEDLDVMSDKARKFVVSEKNWDKQTERIVKFIGL